MTLLIAVIIVIDLVCFVGWVQGAPPRTPFLPLDHEVTRSCDLPDVKGILKRVTG